MFSLFFSFFFFFFLFLFLVYPVIACIVGGLALSATFGTRQLRKHNDIVINKSQPRQYLSHPYDKVVKEGYRTHMQPHQTLEPVLVTKH